MPWLRMLVFHLRLFGKNTYFSQLMVTSTLSILALQLLAAHGNGAPDSEPLWLRAGMVGTWSVCTVAAGMIGFQRFQGTLVHLLMTPSSPSRTLLPLVASAATFGLLAFPLAGLGSAVFGRVPSAGSWTVLALGVLLFWLSCLSISSLVSAVFVLTPNAITYEGLLTVPLVLLSGVFGIPAAVPSAVVALTYALPTTPAVRIVLDQPTGTELATLLLACVGLCLLWGAAARWALFRAARRARVTGTLEVV